MLDPNLDERDRQIIGCSAMMIDLSYTLLPEKRRIIKSKHDFLAFFDFKSANFYVCNTYKEENQL